MSTPLPTRLPTAEEKIQEVLRLKREATKVETLYRVYQEQYEAAMAAYARSRDELVVLIERDMFNS